MVVTDIFQEVGQSELVEATEAKTTIEKTPEQNKRRSFVY